MREQPAVGSSPTGAEQSMLGQQMLAAVRAVLPDQLTGTGARRSRAQPPPGQAPQSAVGLLGLRAARRSPQPLCPSIPPTVAFSGSEQLRAGGWGQGCSFPWLPGMQAPGKVSEPQHTPRLSPSWWPGWAASAAPYVSSWTQQLVPEVQASGTAGSGVVVGLWEPPAAEEPRKRPWLVHPNPKPLPSSAHHCPGHLLDACRGGSHQAPQQAPLRTSFLPLPVPGS